MDKPKTQKELGQVFTPSWIVSGMLDRIDYQGRQILHHNVLEPSFGDGAFLTDIVRRYIQEAKQEACPADDIKEGLETRIFGMELDDAAYTACIKKLNLIAEEHGIASVKWNLHKENALTFYNTLPPMDVVVGNPPYVRIHHLSKNDRRLLQQEFSFCKTGMVDLYLAFFELGIEKLKETGKLMYITPHSFLQNASAKTMRSFVKEHRLLSDILHFQDTQVFEGYSTYTAITFLEKGKTNDRFTYQTYNNGTRSKPTTLSLQDFPDRWSFADEKGERIKKQATEGRLHVKDKYQVQHGMCTLRDKLFMSNNVKETEDEELVLFNGHLVEKALLRPAMKISTYKGKGLSEYALFPYEEQNGEVVVIDKQTLKIQFPYAYAYFCFHQEELEKRDLRGNTLWYEYGRSQGIQDIQHERLVISPMFKDDEKTPIQTFLVPQGVVVYSGLFATGEDLEQLKRLLESRLFKQYASVVGRDYRGGYKTFSPKDIKEVALSEVWR